MSIEMNTTTEVFHLSRPFLSMADYFLNNDRDRYTNTPLNSVIPISSMEENLHIP